MSRVQIVQIVPGADCSEQKLFALIHLDRRKKWKIDCPQVFGTDKVLKSGTGRQEFFSLTMRREIQKTNASFIVREKVSLLVKALFSVLNFALHC